MMMYAKSESIKSKKQWHKYLIRFESNVNDMNAAAMLMHHY